MIFDLCLGEMQRSRAVDFPWLFTNTADQIIFIQHGPLGDLCNFDLSTSLPDGLSPARETRIGGAAHLSELYKVEWEGVFMAFDIIRHAACDGR